MNLSFFNLFLVWGCVFIVTLPLWFTVAILRDIRTLLTKAAKK